MPLKFSVCPKSLFVLVSELGRVSLLTTKVDVGSAKDFYKSYVHETQTCIDLVTGHGREYRLDAGD
ncbi:MAG: hypothetical protein RLZZ343_524 [Actinomycetota bacterium]|jgi:hypothetical protein